MARFHHARIKTKSALSGVWLSLGLFAIVFAIFIFGTVSLSAGSAKRQRESLENALTRDIVYCYATTGKYPESLSYLEKNYGLAVNKKDFKVIYTPYAENMPPQVRVIYIGEKN